LSKQFKIDLVSKNEIHEKFPFVVLYKVTLKDKKVLYLFNVWLKKYNGEKSCGNYVNRFHEAIKLEEYDKILKNEPSIIVGDFNISQNNNINKWKKISNILLDKYDIESAWHKYNSIDLGKEGDENLTLLHSRGKFHCDLCLYSTKYFHLINSHIDNTAIAKKLSDHNALITELEWK
jgi:endonuclease/exonuclease/phosphatase family metal-dependent hydrolase